MKNKIISSLVIIITLISCSTEETPIQNDAVQKTDVAFLIASPSNESSKQVQRGDIPVWVNRVDILAVSGSYSKSDQFDLVANNSNSSIDKNFVLSDVAIGSNVFTASSTTDSAKKYVLVPSNGTAEAKILELKAHNPYVLYSGTTTKVIAPTANIVNIDMTTKHGRILSVFQLENNTAFRNGYEASVTAKVDGETSAGTTKVQKDVIVYFEWSNDKSLEGKKVTYTIDVAPINNNNNLHTIYTIDQVIKA